MNSGAKVTTQLSGYKIDDQLHHQHERQFVVKGDEPSEFGAGDTAPAPPEMLMHAVANCILATANAYAAAGGEADTAGGDPRKRCRSARYVGAG